VEYSERKERKNIILIAPTEPPQLHSIGKTSPITEKYGSDILFSSKKHLIGIQRKSFPDDFLASLYDGRLQKEAAQMKRLHTAILLLEGKPFWTLDGALIDNNRRFSIAQLRSLCWSLNLHGIVTDFTSSITDTAEYVKQLYKWTKKEKHISLVRRPKTQGNWGKASSEDYAMFLLQSFPGVGVTLAKNIYSHFNGLPFQWDCTKKELTNVAGIGRHRAKTLWEMFDTKIRR